jgi:hypothetical protein
VSYFGLNNVEKVDGGFRGRITSVTGFLAGESLLTLANLENSFRALSDGQARDLTDCLGTVWSNVTLESFQPTGRLRHSSQGLFLRSYKAIFMHLN